MGELWGYVNKYYEEMIESLEEESMEVSKNRLQNIYSQIDNQSTI